jgi:hypothetical protein
MYSHSSPVDDDCLLRRLCMTRHLVWRRKSQLLPPLGTKLGTEGLAVQRFGLSRECGKVGNLGG